MKHEIHDHCWSYVYTGVCAEKWPLYLALDFSKQNLVKKKSFVECFSEANCDLYL